MRNNILVQYRGGGYSGCFWEWNYFFIDAEGQFFNIWASGRHGITRAEDAESVMNDPHTYTYDVSSDQEMKTFALESNPIHVLGCVQWLTRHGYGEHAGVYCTKCGALILDWPDLLKDISPDNPQFGNWKGDGGIGFQCEDIFCENCAHDNGD